MGCRERDLRWRLNAPVVGTPASTDRDRAVGWCAMGCAGLGAPGTAPKALRLEHRRASHLTSGCCRRARGCILVARAIGIATVRLGPPRRVIARSRTTALGCARPPDDQTILWGGNVQVSCGGHCPRRSSAHRPGEIATESLGCAPRRCAAGLCARASMRGRGCRARSARWIPRPPVIGAPASTERDGVVGLCATRVRRGSGGPDTQRGVLAGEHRALAS